MELKAHANADKETSVQRRGVYFFFLAAFMPAHSYESCNVLTTVER